MNFILVKTDTKTKPTERRGRREAGTDFKAYKQRTAEGSGDVGIAPLNTPGSALSLVRPKRNRLLPPTPTHHLEKAG